MLFRIIFHLLCVVFTVGMVVRWTLQYLMDEDLSRIKYTHYLDSEEDVYPVLSLCFTNPFVNEKLQNFDPSLQEDFIDKVLTGEAYDNILLNMIYDDISFNLEDFTKEYWIRWQNGTTKRYSMTSFTEKIFSNTYTGFWRGQFYNCFGVQVLMKILRKESNVLIEGFALLLRNDIFPHAIRPTNTYFITFLHYPKQILLALPSVKYRWQKRTNISTYNMAYTINEMEILRRRKKPNSICNENWKHFDDIAIERHIRRVGCRPIYYKENVDVPLCNNETIIRNAIFPFRSDEIKKYAPPCKEVRKIDFTYEERDLSDSIWGDEGAFWVTILLLDSRYKEVVQTRYNNAI